MPIYEYTCLECGVIIEKIQTPVHRENASNAAGK